MLGLPVLEQPIGVRYPKSHKFADHLAGRFFVSGVSGSFRKTRRKGTNDSDPVLDPAIANAAKQASRMRKEEQIRQDAQRMYDLECKLTEIQQKKELRRNRDEIRKQKRKEYLSAVLIQRTLMRYVLRLQENERAVICIEAFLKSLSAKQAVTAASWAACVIGRFAIKVTLRMKGKKFIRRRSVEIQDEKAANYLEVIKRNAAIAKSRFLLEISESDGEGEGAGAGEEDSEEGEDRTQGTREDGELDDIFTGSGSGDSCDSVELNGMTSVLNPSSPASEIMSMSGDSDHPLHINISTSTPLSQHQSGQKNAKKELKKRLVPSVPTVTNGSGNNMKTRKGPEKGKVNKKEIGKSEDETEIVDKIDGQAEIEEKERLKKLHVKLMRDRRIENEKKLAAAGVAAGEPQEKTAKEKAAEKVKALNEFNKSLRLEQAAKAKEQAKLRLERNRKEAIIALEREREIIEMKCMYKEDHRVMILLLSRRGSSTKGLKLDTASAGGGAGVKESLVGITGGSGESESAVVVTEERSNKLHLSSLLLAKRIATKMRLDQQVRKERELSELSIKEQQTQLAARALEALQRATVTTLPLPLSLPLVRNGESKSNKDRDSEKNKDRDSEKSQTDSNNQTSEIILKPKKKKRKSKEATVDKTIDSDIDHNIDQNQSIIPSDNDNATDLIQRSNISQKALSSLSSISPSPTVLSARGRQPSDPTTVATSSSSSSSSSSAVGGTASGNGSAGTSAPLSARSRTTTPPISRHPNTDPLPHALTIAKGKEKEKEKSYKAIIPIPKDLKRQKSGLDRQSSMKSLNGIAMRGMNSKAGSSLKIIVGSEKKMNMNINLNSSNSDEDDDGPSSQSSRMGKVASLLAIVSRARKKLDQPQSSTQGSLNSSSSMPMIFNTGNGIGGGSIGGGDFMPLPPVDSGSHDDRRDNRDDTKRERESGPPSISVNDATVDFFAPLTVSSETSTSPHTFHADGTASGAGSGKVTGSGTGAVSGAGTPLLAQSSDLPLYTSASAISSARTSFSLRPPPSLTPTGSYAQLSRKSSLQNSVGGRIGFVDYRDQLRAGDFTPGDYNNSPPRPVDNVVTNIMPEGNKIKKMKKKKKGKKKDKEEVELNTNTSGKALSGTVQSESQKGTKITPGNSTKTSPKGTLKGSNSSTVNSTSAKNSQRQRDIEEDDEDVLAAEYRKLRMKMERNVQNAVSTSARRDSALAVKSGSEKTGESEKIRLDKIREYEEYEGDSPSSALLSSLPQTSVSGNTLQVSFAAATTATEEKSYRSTSTKSTPVLASVLSPSSSSKKENQKGKVQEKEKVKDRNVSPVRKGKSNKDPVSDSIAAMSAGEILSFFQEQDRLDEGVWESDEDEEEDEEDDDDEDDEYDGSVDGGERDRSTSDVECSGSQFSTPQSRPEYSSPRARVGNSGKETGTRVGDSGKGTGTGMEEVNESSGPDPSYRSDLEADFDTDEEEEGEEEEEEGAENGEKDREDDEEEGEEHGDGNQAMDRPH